MGPGVFLFAPSPCFTDETSSESRLDLLLKVLPCDHASPRGGGANQEELFSDPISCTNVHKLLSRTQIRLDGRTPRPPLIRRQQPPKAMADHEQQEKQVTWQYAVNRQFDWTIHRPRLDASVELCP